MVQQESLVTDEMRDAIGVESEPYSGPVEKDRVRLFAEAIGDPNPIYVDEQYARKTHYGGLITPPTFPCIIDRRRPGGRHPVQGWGGRPYKKPPKSMHAFDEWEWFEPIRVGDIITAKNRLNDFYEKPGNKGPLLFSIAEIEYRNQFGELVARHITGDVSYSD